MVIVGDQCPMHFDDGTDPWIPSDNTIKIFDFGLGYLINSSTSSFPQFTFHFLIILLVNYYF